MPFKSKSQQRYMFAEHPKMAKKWAKETDFSKLPEKKKKAEWGMYEDPQLKRIDPYNPELATSASLAAPATAVDPNKLGADYDGAKASVDKDKKKFKIGRPAPVALGPLIQGGLGLINMMLGPENKNRRSLDDSISYNPYPQGTGSQALFEDGGIPVDGGKKAKRKAKKNVIDDANYVNKMSYQGIVNDEGKTIMAPTEFEWLDTMIKYANNNTPESNVYRPQFQHHSAELKDYHPTMAKNGTKLKGRGLQIHEGGSAPQISYNPIDGGMGEFKGRSHAQDGIQSSFNGKPFEAEGGEPYRIDDEGALEIFGNLTNPLSGNKFKKDAKVIARKEKKVQTYLDKGLESLDSTNGRDKFDKLRFNSGTVMMKGALAKHKELAAQKDEISAIQQIMLKESDNMEDGGKVFPDGGKPWSWRGTKKDQLDKRILGFIKLVEEKGLEGYSGEKSGYDKRNTKSGRPSRHGANQALDMMFKDKDAYQKILKDPELSKYLYENGLTAIDEYDPNIASKTGATTGHLHIGLDKGTPTSDRFRQDYRAAYKPKGTPKYVNPSQTKPYSGVNSGDAYTENLYTPEKIPLPKSLQAPPASPAKPMEFDFKNPATTPYVPAKRKLPWEQIAPAIPQVFDQAEYVDKQTYNPELFTPYQVSFQDKINANKSAFNAFAPTLSATNPEALSVLAAQQYNANDSVLAEEFRTNQGISNDVTNKNVALLNDAKLKNIQLADTQYVRQSQAKANTRANRIGAGIQIGDILAKNKLENKTLDVTQQLYKDYKFDENMQLQYVGDQTAGDRITDVAGDSVGYPTRTEVTNIDPTNKTKTKRIYEIPNFQLEKADILKGYRKKNLYKDGGKFTQGKLSKLLNSSQF